MKKIIILSALLLASSVFAADVQEYKDSANNTSNTTSETPKSEGAITYQEPTGVQVTLDKNGLFKKILASGEAELEFGDSKDERQALQKATMRAKASIAKFMNESMKSTETLEEIQKTVSNATAGGDKKATRDTIQTQVEMLENKADALLQGVVTLQQDIDRDKKTVTVTVGVKEETIQAAKDLQGKIKSAETTPSSSVASNTATSEQGGKEIRRSKTMENF